MRVVLLRPPRYVWPFNSETSAFWQPLGLLSLAGAVRRDLPEVQVEVWDAPAERCGWRTLAQRVAAAPIDVLGIGEETVSAAQALRAAALVRQCHPRCIVVAGGPYFPYTAEATLAGGLVDVIVRGDGEVTFVELLRHLHDRARWATISGLVFPEHLRTQNSGIRTQPAASSPSRSRFVRGSAPLRSRLVMETGRSVLTPPRPLIDDLDSLPFPAHDMLDQWLYGRRSRNHPDLVSIEHSRGCIDSCSFCILWKHMGESVNGNGRVRPRWRTKSAERSFDEVNWLYRRFGRRTFGWVDPTFNASPDWSDAWAERVLASDLVGPRGHARTLHTAWMRADGVVRDESLGIIEKLVRAGLRQVMIGVERDDRAGLTALRKHNNDQGTCRKAFAIFRERYPQVYTIGTVIFGLPGDTMEDLHRLADLQYDMGMDYCFIMPLTPNPGTAAAAQAATEGRIANPDPGSYNFHTPVCTTDTLGLRQLESIYWRIMVKPSRRRVVETLRQAVLAPDRRKRRVHRSLLRRGAVIALRSLARSVLCPRGQHPALYWRKPSWYDR